MSRKKERKKMVMEDMWEEMKKLEEKKKWERKEKKVEMKKWGELVKFLNEDKKDQELLTSVRNMVSDGLGRYKIKDADFDYSVFKSNVIKELSDASHKSSDFTFKIDIYCQIDLLEEDLYYDVRFGDNDSDDSDNAVVDDSDSDSDSDDVLDQPEKKKACLEHPELPSQIPDSSFDNTEWVRINTEWERMMSRQSGVTKTEHKSKLPSSSGSFKSPIDIPENHEANDEEDPDPYRYLNTTMVKEDEGSYSRDVSNWDPKNKRIVYPCSDSDFEEFIDSDTEDDEPDTKHASEGSTKVHQEEDDEPLDWQYIFPIRSAVAPRSLNNEASSNL